MSRPPHLCNCGRVVAHSVHCVCQQAADHARKARHDQRRPSAHQRGYDSAWQAASRDFLADPANAHCECGAPAVLVRHIRSIRRFPHLRLEPSNWKPGCLSCNALDAVRERQQ